MNQSHQLLERTLRTQGHSMTHSRKLVFSALEQTARPLAMEELIRIVEPHVNRASVYRIISLFEALGIVQRLQIGWKYKLELSNSFQEHHHHLTCAECGAIIPFHEPKQLHHILEQVTAQHNFRLHNHQLELQGVCADCQK